MACCCLDLVAESRYSVTRQHTKVSHADDFLVRLIAGPSWAVSLVAKSAKSNMGSAMHVRSANDQENALGCWQWSSHAGARKRNSLGLAGLSIGPRLAPWLGLQNGKNGPAKKELTLGLKLSPKGHGPQAKFK